MIPFGYAQITHFFLKAGSTPTGAAVTYGIDLGAALDPALVAEDFHDAFTSTILNQCTIDTAVGSTLCKFGPDSTGAAAEYARTEYGNDGGVACPPNVSFLIQKRTLLGGRQGRGRMYVPGVPEATVDGQGVLTSTIQADMATGIGNFITAANAASNGLVVLHDNLVAPTPITSLVCSERVATQRRRLRR